ncbi:MAG: HupE/UreJ family protein [Gammaproteobacteria bacterium]
MTEGVRPSVIATAALLTLAPAPAGAHLGFAANDLYLGMLHPPLHFATLLPLVGLALWFAHRQGKQLETLATGYLLASIVGALLAVFFIEVPLLSQALLPLSVLIGALVALDKGLPRAIAFTLVLVTALGLGYESVAAIRSEITDPMLYMTGMLLALGLIPLHLTTLLMKRKALWITTGMRIFGSWIATAAILVLVAGSIPLTASEAPGTVPPTQIDGAPGTG